MSRIAYHLSIYRHIFCRKLANLFNPNRFATKQISTTLPTVIWQYEASLLKSGPGIDQQHQLNKVENIRLACRRLHGLIIKPGESFSFWKAVGNPSAANGYLDGRVLINGQITSGPGGGLCNLANALHVTIMHSPLTITELHHHSDALAPDCDGVRRPYSAGTSVKYNYRDFQFRNETNQAVQLQMEIRDKKLIVTLRAENPFPLAYRIVEEGHHFLQEANGILYRISKIYRETIDPHTGIVLSRELKWDNHSRVYF